MKIPYLFLLFFVAIVSNAQTGLYRTFSDYENGKLETVKSIDWVSYSAARYRLHYIDNTGKKDKLKYSDIWGFVYEGHLFRSETTNEGFVMVMAKGKLVYYENAYFQLDALVNKKSEIIIGPYTSSSIMISFVSSDLNSEIIVIPHLITPFSVYKKRWKEFVGQQNQASEFFDCVGKNNNYLTTRDCAVNKL